MQGSRGQAGEELVGGDKVISVRPVSIESRATEVDILCQSDRNPNLVVMHSVQDSESFTHCHEFGGIEQVKEGTTKFGGLPGSQSDSELQGIDSHSGAFFAKWPPILALLPRHTRRQRSPSPV